MPFLRLVLPHLDNERVGAYHIKESKLADILIQVFTIPKDSHDAFLLKQWSSASFSPSFRVGPSVLKHGNYKDFSQVAKLALRDRFNLSSRISLTLHELNEKLDLLVMRSNTSSSFHGALNGITVALFRDILMNLGEKEISWFIKIVLQKSALAVPESYWLQAVGPSAEKFLATYSDLAQLCHYFSDKDNRSKTDSSKAFIDASLFALKPGRPFRPMLSERMDLKDVVREMTLGSPDGFYVEEKIDGERLLVHLVSTSLEGPLKPGQMLFFTRNGRNVTDSYLQSGFAAAFLAMIKKTVRIDADLGANIDVSDEAVADFILDGEMVSYDVSNEKILPFGTLSYALQGEAIDGNTTKPLFMVFDLLFLNGKSLLQTPLHERLRLLEGLIDFRSDPDSRIARSVPRQFTTTSSALLDALELAIKSQKEGIIVKKRNSLYHPGRRSTDWIKIRSDYIKDGHSSGHLCTDLDVIVVGANYGKGIIGDPSHLAEFWCAVRRNLASDDEADHDDDALDAHQADCSFLTFCKVGSGFTVQENLALESLVLPTMVPLAPHRKKEVVYHCEQAEVSASKVTIEFSENSSARPDVICRNPSKKAVVITVKGFEFISSFSYATNITLRFPRFQRSRPDKDHQDILTLKQLRRMASEDCTNFLLHRDVIENDHHKVNAIVVDRRKSMRRRNLQMAPGFESLPSKAAKVLDDESDTDDEAFPLEDKEDRRRKGGKDPLDSPKGLFAHLEFCIVSASYGGPTETTKKSLMDLITKQNGTLVQYPNEGQTICVAHSIDSFRVKSLIKSGKYTVVKPSWLFKAVQEGIVSWDSREDIWFINS